MSKKLDPYQSLEREEYLWKGSMAGLGVAFVLFATTMLVMGLDASRYPRLVPAFILATVAISSAAVDTSDSFTGVGLIPNKVIWPASRRLGSRHLKNVRCREDRR